MEILLNNVWSVFFRVLGQRLLLKFSVFGAKVGLDNYRYGFYAEYS